MNRILGLQNSSGRRILGAQNYVPIGVVGDIVNSRDARLQLEYPRTTTAADRLLLLLASESYFWIASNGAISPASITFTPYMLGMTGAIAYGVSSGATLTFPGGVPTLDYGNMSVEACVVTASVTVDGITYSSQPVKISKERDGAAEITADTVLQLLEGQITDSELEASLLDRIDLVTGPASNPQTVQGRVKAETDARVAAITQEGEDRVTYVQSYTYSKTESDNSLSVFATTVTAQYKAYADGAANAAVSTSTAYVQTYAYSKATSDSSLSSLASTLRSEFASNNGVSVAYLNNYAYSKADTNSAISSATQTLSTTVGQNTSTLQTQATTINGLSAQYTVKTDINGYVTGYGLASSIATGTPTSVFIINAGAFSVVAPGGAPTPMFTVGTVAGVTKAVLRGDMFADGSVTARSLQIGLGGLALNKDPNFVDIAGSWNGPSNLVVGAGAGGNGPASTFIGMGPAAGGIIFCNERISIDPSKTYLLAASLYQDSGMSNLCITLIDFYDNAGNHLATSWGDSTYSGYPLVVTPPAGTWTTYRSGIFGPSASNGHVIPAGAKTCRIGASLNANGGLQSGLMALTGFRLEDMVGTTSIIDGAITAQKITVDKLQAISSIVVARIGATGAGVDMDSNGARTYDTNSIKRFQWGNLDV